MRLVPCHTSPPLAQCPRHAEACVPAHPETHATQLYSQTERPRPRPCAVCPHASTQAHKLRTETYMSAPRRPPRKHCIVEARCSVRAVNRDMLGNRQWQHRHPRPCTAQHCPATPSGARVCLRPLRRRARPPTRVALQALAVPHHPFGASTWKNTSKLMMPKPCTGKHSEQEKSRTRLKQKKMLLPTLLKSFYNEFKNDVSRQLTMTSQRANIVRKMLHPAKQNHPRAPKWTSRQSAGGCKGNVPKQFRLNCAHAELCRTHRAGRS